MASTIYKGVAAEHPFARPPTEHEVLAVAGSVLLPGTLAVPPNARGIILLASSQEGASHCGAISRTLTDVLCDAGLAVLSIDPVTVTEACDDIRAESTRNDLPVVSQRIEGVTDWLVFHPELQGLPVGYLGIGATATEAMITAAAARTDVVHALVLFEGRPDLAARSLGDLKAPVRVIVDDEEMPLASELAAVLARAAGPAEFVQIPGDVAHAASVSAERTALARVADLAEEWFLVYLSSYSSHPEERRRR